MKYGNSANVERSGSPLLLLAPHIGQEVPADVRGRANWMNAVDKLADPAGKILWEVAPTLGASLICGEYHPNVIDLNAETDDPELTPHFNRLRVCPYQVEGAPLYEGEAQYIHTVGAKIAQHWRPFHDAVRQELSRLRATHENVLILVFHASQWLRSAQGQGATQDCTISTNRGVSADHRLVEILTRHVESKGYSWVVNPANPSGAATRRYGSPLRGTHVLELEIGGRWRTESGRDPYPQNKVIERRDLQDSTGALVETISVLLNSLRIGLSQSYDRSDR